MKVKRLNVFLANRRHRESIKRDDVSAFLPVTNNRRSDVSVDKVSRTVSACSFVTFYLLKPYLSRHKISIQFAFALKVIRLIRYLDILIVYRRVIKRNRTFDVNKKKEKGFTVIKFSQVPDATYVQGCSPRDDHAYGIVLFKKENRT